MNIKIIAIVAGLLASGYGAKYYFIDVPAAEAAAAQAAQIEQDREKAKQEALMKFMHQGNGTIRKPGESGFKKFDFRHL
ncbi:MAG: hypothetical protein ACXV79_00695 [Methylobacter sp.]